VFDSLNKETIMKTLLILTTIIILSQSLFGASKLVLKQTPYDILIKQSTSGDAFAAYALGVHFENGRFKSKHQYEIALHFYTKAVNRGLIEAIKPQQRFLLKTALVSSK
jgi:hypothetical protein